MSSIFYKLERGMNLQDKEVLKTILAECDKIIINDIINILRTVGIEMSDGSVLQFIRKNCDFDLSPAEGIYRSRSGSTYKSVRNKIHLITSEKSVNYMMRLFDRFYQRFLKDEIVLSNGVAYRNDLMGKECADPNYRQWGEDDVIMSDYVFNGG